jgi:16S rRNA (guanine527-N7)-methyltransferase
MPDDDLVRVLSEIQRRGAIGRTSLPDEIAHADRFVRALPPVGTGPMSLVDLGSGGGLPGLVIAHRRPELVVTLVERRTKRVDLLRYGIRALGLLDSVTVYDGDIADYSGRSDVVTARSFGPPLMVLEVSAAITTPGGSVLISEPPSGMPRWSVDDISALGFVDHESLDGIRRFVRL